MNPLVIIGWSAAVLTWLAVGAVIAGITDAYLHKKPGSPAGIAMGMVFWPIALGLGCLAFLGVGLWALNKVAYEQAYRVREMRATDGRILRADEPPLPREAEAYGEILSR